ncbi:MAG: serine hydrolase [Sphingomicrobium sp.]
MKSVLRRVVMGLGMIACSGAGSGQLRDPLAPLPSPPPPPPQRTQPTFPAPRQAVPNLVNNAAPYGLRDTIERIGRSFDGKAGIAIISLGDGWEVDYNANSLFPQQSCSKLWVAITALDAVDRGQLSLSDRVTLGRDDLTLFHQPLAAKILGGGHTTTIGALMFTAITESDNTANDKLMRSVGGPDAVRATIANKGLGAIRFFNGERSLQSKIAGLTWSQSYSIGDAFYKARSALPMPLRRASFERYLSDPYDGAAPHAVAASLARLKRGELLSPASTARLLNTMGQTRTGKARVRAALAPGWRWNHKTGTGQVLGGRIGGINDIGLLTAPDGTVYAMALMAIPNRSGGQAQGMMQAVTKAVIAAHQQRRGGR